MPQAQAGQLRLPTARAGNYSADESGFWPRAYSVNTPPEESDLRRVEPQKVTHFFPSQACLIISSNEQLPRERQAQQMARSLGSELAAVLLTLLIIETLFANRFYKRTPASNASGAS